MLTADQSLTEAAAAVGYLSSAAKYGLKRRGGPQLNLTRKSRPALVRRHYNRRKFASCTSSVRVAPPF